jgi:Flp pilus assembly protein TadG
MLASARKISRRLASETRGAEIAEAAAVMPVMFMVLLGIFWFGQAFSMYGTITRAAQDGARAGAAPHCTTCASGGASSSVNAYNAVEAALNAANLDASNARYPVAPPSVTACPSGTGSTTCDGTASGTICVQTGIELSNTTAGATGVCGVSVSFQYPFQFVLPYASISNQKIWLTASARARVEAQ